MTLQKAHSIALAYQPYLSRATAVLAALIALAAVPIAVIANAARPGVLDAVVGGAHVGTWFPARQRPHSRKLWIAFAAAPQGSLVVDHGAVRALVERGSSLLAVGVTEVLGDFDDGVPVNVLSPDHQVIARGLVGFDADEVRAMAGRPTGEPACCAVADRASPLHADASAPAQTAATHEM